MEHNTIKLNKIKSTTILQKVHIHVHCPRIELCLNSNFKLNLQLFGYFIKDQD